MNNLKMASGRKMTKPQAALVEQLQAGASMRLLTDAMGRVCWLLRDAQGNDLRAVSKPVGYAMFELRDEQGRMALVKVSHDGKVQTWALRQS